MEDLSKRHDQSVYCRGQFVKPNTPCMGNLPKERLYDNAKPFFSIGIEHFGPIKVKAIKCAIWGNICLFNYESITSRNSI